MTHIDSDRCSECNGTGHPRGNIYTLDDCAECRGLGFHPETPCCSSCGEEHADLTETGEDNGGSPWWQCEDCLRAERRAS